MASSAAAFNDDLQLHGTIDGHFAEFKDCLSRKGEEIVVTLRAYIDDSGDGNHERFAAIGAVIAGTGPWQEFEKKWASATFDLKGPFHATDCEARQDIFKGWSIERSNKLMRDLVSIIYKYRVMTFSAVVPLPEYRAVFPNGSKNDPFLLVFGQALMNLGQIGADISSHQLGVVGARCVIEDGESLAGAYDLWHKMRRIESWKHAKFLSGFSTDSKHLIGLQAADLMAREAFKHADNLGIRPIRKPVKALRDRMSIHLWNKDCLEYVKRQGWPNDLTSLTNWGKGDPAPNMIRFYADTFDDDRPA